MKIPFISRLFPSRASPKDSFWGSAYSFFFGTSSSGKSVNEKTALQTMFFASEKCMYLQRKI